MPTTDDEFEQQPDVDATGDDPGTEAPAAGKQQPEDQDLEQPDPDEDEEDGSGKSRAARQAARYRTELREAKTKLEQATTQLDRARRQIIESYARHTLSDPAVLWRLYKTAEFLDDDGLVDKTKVDKTVGELVKAFSVTRPGGAPVPSQGTGRPDPNKPSGFTSGFDHHNTNFSK